MIKLIFRFIANLLVCILPFSGVLMPYAPSKGNYTFPEFLSASAVFTVVVILIGLYGAYSVKSKKSEMIKGLVIPAWILFLTGILAAIPLSMDAPPPADIWLKTVQQEHFRFAMLLLVSLFFAAGSGSILALLWKGLTLSGKGIVLPLLLATVISLWDFYDLFVIDGKMREWTHEGKDISHFFDHYDFREDIRALGRILLYLTTAWLTLVLRKKQMVLRWESWGICLFCMAGICCCILFIYQGVSFYFPFMVPAIALAPAYWLGIALLNSRRGTDAQDFSVTKQ